MSAVTTSAANRGLEIFTLGQLSAMLGRPPHQVRYALKSRGIRPCFRNGSFTAYNRDAVEKLKLALSEIDANAGR